MSKVKKDGIGIENFLQGKVIFITGATGFLAKALVEKILRSMPDVSKIYLMIRGEDEEDAKRRMKKEIVDIELFKCLKQKYGEHYEAFMWTKLVAVVGNVEDSNLLGMEQDLAIQIAKDVQIIINGAGDTGYHQRYDVALQVNAMGPCNGTLPTSAKTWNSSCIFHQNAASVRKYSREGRSMEEMECLSLRDNTENATTILKNEMQLTSEYKKLLKHNNVALKMKVLGLTRAKGYGWANTYGFTKALGEMLIDKMRGQISAPILILRPSGILSTYKDPFPGWIEGNKLADPIILHYGKGKLTGFPLNPNCAVGLIPADIVVNASLVAMAKHVLMARKPDINIYHLCSTTSNPLVYDHLFASVYQHFKSRPIIDPNGRAIQVSEMKFFNSLQDFSDHLSRSISKATAWPDRVSSEKILKFMKFKEHAEYLATIHSPYTFHTCWLDDSKTRGLIERMCEEEKKKFGCDVKSIDWKDFIVNVHIPGLRRHILNEKPAGLSKM